MVLSDGCLLVTKCFSFKRTLFSVVHTFASKIFLGFVTFFVFGAFLKMHFSCP